jgi:hypothetical protein
MFLVSTKITNKNKLNGKKIKKRRAIENCTNKQKQLHKMFVEKYINLVQHHNISVVMIVDMYMKYFLFHIRTAGFSRPLQPYLLKKNIH